MTNTRLEGTVKWFDPRKGFGFIESDENQEDIFVHYLEIRLDGFKLLTEGQRVEFTLLTRNRGFAAEDVDVLTSSPQVTSTPIIEHTATV